MLLYNLIFKGKTSGMICFQINDQMVLLRASINV